MNAFGKEGIVSLWLFLNEEDPADVGKDVLKEFCGVDYYDLDSQEGVIFSSPTELSTLLAQLSYSDSFVSESLVAAHRMGIESALGAIAQFDFAYDPNEVSRAIAADPVFVGCFAWHD